MADAPGTLVLLRHGESEWNAKNLFTGWVDVDLSDKGTAEASRGGSLLAEAGVLPDVVHTSVLRRAITTANLALDGCRPALDPGAPLLAAERAALRRPAGQGQEADARRVRRGAVHALAPLLRHPAAADRRRRRVQPGGRPRYADLAPETLPRTECLKDVVARMLPYWYDAIVPDLRTGATVLVTAHGNSLRALVKHLDGISDDAIAGLNIPTGIPLRLRPRRLAASRPDRRGVPRPRRCGGGDRGRQEPGPLTGPVGVRVGSARR